MFHKQYPELFWSKAFPLVPAHSPQLIVYSSFQSSILLLNVALKLLTWQVCFLSPAFSAGVSFALCENWVLLLNTAICKSRKIFKPDVPVLMSEKKNFPLPLGLSELMGGWVLKIFLLLVKDVRLMIFLIHTENTKTWVASGNLRVFFLLWQSRSH